MTIPSTPATLTYIRQNVRDLLNEFDAADALAGYYTLYHPDHRTTIYMRRGDDNKVDGFLTVCQTGIDLFRPLVTLRVRGAEALPDLLQEGLAPGKPYLLIVPAFLLDRLEPHLALADVTRQRILRLDPNLYRPEMNTLVIHKDDQNGHPRTEIRHARGTVAVAGVNWRSPLFAEIFVQVEEPHRGKGMGWAVVNALVADLLKLEVMPLYTVAESNTVSLELAERVGFVDTGAREIMAQAVRR